MRPASHKWLDRHAINHRWFSAHWNIHKLTNIVRDQKLCLKWLWWTLYQDLAKWWRKDKPKLLKQDTSDNVQSIYPVDSFLHLPIAEYYSSWYTIASDTIDGVFILSTLSKVDMFMPTRKYDVIGGSCCCSNNKNGWMPSFVLYNLLFLLM